jgi:tripartite-type tricarboxylate transporter receptor subunit TctC
MPFFLRRPALPLATITCAMCAMFPATASGQAFPSKPIRIIVAFPAGGGTDIVARMIAPKLGEALGTQVVIDNRAGAQGIVGTELAAKAPADGHTLFMGTLGNIAVNPVLWGNKLPFNMERDFAPLTQVVDVWFLQMIHPSLPAKNPRELIALAKARPGELNYYSSGAGGAPHLAAEMFHTMAGVKTTHVPYKGSAPGMTDLMAGQVQIGYDSVVQSLPFVKAGKLRALAILGAKRTPLLPDTPVMKDFLPGFELTNWFALVIPAATPVDIRNRLHAEVVKVLRAPDIRERLIGMGAEPVGSTQEQFGAFIKSEMAKWGKVIRDANIKPEL